MEEEVMMIETGAGLVDVKLTLEEVDLLFDSP